LKIFVMRPLADISRSNPCHFENAGDDKFQLRDRSIRSCHENRQPHAQHRWRAAVALNWEPSPQGSLTPPGAPKPTMKSLPEIWDKLGGLEAQTATRLFFGSVSIWI
jgi:hypothetical protein